MSLIEIINREIREHLGAVHAVKRALPEYTTLSVLLLKCAYLRTRGKHDLL